MIIRKLFKYEMGHIVRKAWSRRCSHSIHGHSYLVEFLFEDYEMDRGGMVIDFGFIKKFLHPFVDSFDHATMLWDLPEDREIVDLFKNQFERVITASFTSTAEVQAKMFLQFAVDSMDYMKANNLFENEEQNPRATKVIVHETTTGYAEANLQDLVHSPLIDCRSMWFSDAIKEEWTPEVKAIMGV